MTKEEIKGFYSMGNILERYNLPNPNRAEFIYCPLHKEKTANIKYTEKIYIFHSACLCQKAYSRIHVTVYMHLKNR